LTEGSRTPRPERDTDLESSIFIDEDEQSDEETQNGASGAMQIVDSGYFNYNWSKLERKLRKLSFNPSTRSRGQNLHPLNLEMVFGLRGK